jgi:SAM-dependent methyltransferase
VPRDNPPHRNVCAGPVGAAYNFYIQRPRLARLVLGSMWGVDSRPFYRSIEAVGEMPEGATILDVPCGGGVALRGLRPDQHVSWIGVDLEPAMLRRTQRRAAPFPNVQTRLIEADMASLPLEDGIADLCITYGGLHCVRNPHAALAEMTRCLRPGGSLLGSTFVVEGSRRQRRLLRSGDFGHTPPAHELRRWLLDCGLSDVSLDREDGLVVFKARRVAEAQQPHTHSSAIDISLNSSYRR